MTRGRITAKGRRPLVSRDKRTVYVDDPEYYGYEWDGKGDYVQYDEDDEEKEYPHYWSYGDEFDTEMEFVKEYMGRHDGPFVMYGTIGLWDGAARTGGRIIRNFDEFGDAIRPRYPHELYIYDEDGDLHIIIGHHDGTHHMVMRELSKRGAEYYDRHASYSGYLDSDEFTRIATQKGYTKRMNFADEMYGKIPKRKNTASRNVAAKKRPSKTSGKATNTKKTPTKRETVSKNPYKTRRLN